jgi:hypothetical protein
MKSEFPYRELLSVHPSLGEFTPARITCPSCGTELRVTAKSRLFAAGAVFSSLLAGIFALVRLHIHLPEWQTTLLAFSAIAAYYFAIWPLIVRLKPWTPFQYWLPKSRLVGYSVYLLIPLALMVLLLCLAVKFRA